MITVEESVDIDLPLVSAFDYFAEFAHIAEWDPGVVSARKLTEGPLAAGDRYQVMSKFAGQRIPMRYEVLNLDAPHRVVLEGLADMSRANDTIRFESLGPARTRVVWRLELSFTGPARLSEPLMRPLVKRLGKNAMRGIREAVALGLPAR